MDPVRCHPTVIIENIFRFFRQLLPGLIFPIFAASQFDQRLLIIAVIVAAGLLFAVIYQIFAWRRTWLSIEQDQLVIASGLIWKKNKKIPFDKINTIDLGRNIFQRVFGTCRVKVDTGVVTGGSKKDAEVNLVFDLELAEEIRSRLLDLSGHAEILSFSDGLADETDQAVVQTSDGKSYTHRTSEPSTARLKIDRLEYRARPMDFFLYGLTQSKALAVLGAGFGLLALAGEWLDERAYDLIGESAARLWSTISQWNIILTLLFAGALFFALYLVANLASILFAVVRYYGFTASREGSNLHIEYGLLTAKSYTLPIRNVHAVVISQNFFRRVLGQASCEVISIGYGDEKNEVALLFPLLAMNQLDEQLSRILPEYKVRLDLDPAPRRAWYRFFIRPVAALAAFIVLSLVFWPPALLALIVLVPWLLGSGWLSYRHAGLACSPNQVEAQNGGWTRRRYRVVLEAVQSVGTSSHPLLERSRLCHYRIDYHAPSLRAVIRVRYLENCHLDRLRRLLDQND